MAFLVNKKTLLVNKSAIFQTSQYSNEETKKGYQSITFWPKNPKKKCDYYNVDATKKHKTFGNLCLINL